MKKIIIIFIFIITTINLTFSYNYDTVNNKLLKYYNKIDNKIPKLENRIKKLEYINRKIDYILKNKKLSSSKLELLKMIELSIDNRISFYKLYFDYDNIVNKNIHNNKEKVNVDKLIEDNKGNNISNKKSNIFQELKINDKKYFFINSYKYSESEYKKFYDLYLEIGKKCVKDITEKEGDSKMICKKGQYGEYYIKGERVSYSKFMKYMFQLAYNEMIKEQEKKQKQEIIDVKSGLKNYTIFKEIYISGKQPYYGEFYQLGDKCPLWQGSILINGKGINIVKCENKKITELKYIVDNKEVTKEQYIKATFNQLRKDWNIQN